MSPPHAVPASDHTLARSFFARPAPVLFVFGAFALIFLPMLALALGDHAPPLLEDLTLAHGVGLGLTHFVVTFALYLQSAHRDHFRSSGRRRAIYFVTPALILLTFALTALLGLRERAPAAAAIALIAVRFADFFHVGRQSFGVLQLFKDPTSMREPGWRRDENRFFVGLALLQWLTFVGGGRFQPRAPHVALISALLGAVFVGVIARYLAEARAYRAERSAVLRALAYFVMQAFSGACAVYDTRLYLIGLTLHYVEYHVLMAPRCLQTPLDLGRFSDRLVARLRRHAVVFYGLLLGLAVLLYGIGARAGGDPASASTLVHLFDGLFIAHYFVEAFLWRMHEPFYRAQLLPLYGLGRPRPTPAPVEAPALGLLDGAPAGGQS